MNWKHVTNNLLFGDIAGDMNFEYIFCPLAHFKIDNFSAQPSRKVLSCRDAWHLLFKHNNSARKWLLVLLL